MPFCLEKTGGKVYEKRIENGNGTLRIDAGSACCWLCSGRAPKAPVAVETECDLVQRIHEEFTVKKMTITETEKDSFSKGDIVLTGHNMYFRIDGKESFSQNGVKGSYAERDKNLVVSVEDSDDDKLESITLEGIRVTPAKTMWNAVTYSLYNVQEDGSQVVVDDDFVTVIEPIRPSKEYRIELKLDEKTLTVNGEQKDLRVSAYISDQGYTMLPLREIAEVFPGTQVYWDQATKTANVCTKEKIAVVKIGEDQMTISGQKTWMKEKAVVKDGRTFLSIRDVCRICDITDIKWDAATKTVTLHAFVEGYYPGER